MAIKLEDKQNVIAPNATFPFGDLKDNSGANDGVPLNRAVISDYWQFFAKMLDASGIVANGLLENDTNGFQYFDALIANIRATAATTTQKGTVERATQSELNAGTDDERYITALKILGATAIITSNALQNDAVTTAKILNDAVTTAKILNDAITLAKMASNSVGTDQIINDAVTAAKILDGAITDSKLDTPRIKIAAGTAQLIAIIIPIGDWDMDATPAILVPHGLTYDKIKIPPKVTIRDDGDNLRRSLKNTPAAGQVDGNVTWDDTNVILNRHAGGIFDGPTFDSTGFNRGWVYIEYEE